jgi:hypothetical protein
MQPRLVPPQQALAVISPTGLATRGQALDYVRGALGSPVCVATAVFAACVGLGIAGIIGAMLALGVVFTGGVSASKNRVVRRHLDHQARLAERCRRESQRLKALRPCGPVRQQQYIELRDLVEQIERTDSTEAARFELQDLLDHFIRLALAHQRCLEALRLAGSHDLPQTIPFADPTRSKRRREIMARRMRHREECLQRVERLADELDAVDELVRLVAQRTACPALDPDLDREIERRLWELDEVEAALNQLSA